MNEISPRKGWKNTISGALWDRRPDLSVEAFRMWALAVLAAAAALRFTSIDRYEIWLDEAYCFAVARKAIGSILTDLALDNGPPLYYIMLHYWMKLFGDSTLALRSLSALFSIATAAVMLAWNTPWLSRKARLFSAGVLAITPLSIYYAQETRMYSPVVFFVVASMVFVERGLRLGKFRDWALCTLSTALSLYTSYAAVFVLPVAYVVVIVRFALSRDSARTRARLTGLIISHVAAAALFAPWIPTFAHQPSAQAVQWVREMWDNCPDKYSLPLESITVMGTGGAYYPPYLRNMCLDELRVQRTREAIAEGREQRPLLKLLVSIPPRIPYVILLSLSAVLTALALARREQAFPYRTFLTAWALLSFMLPYLASFMRPMYVPGRYDLAGVPAFAAIQGLALSRLRKAFRIPLAALLGALFVYEYGYMQLWPGTGRFSPKAKALASVVSKGDVVIGPAFEHGQSFYHVGPVRDDLVWVTFPRETINHFAWIDYDKWLLPGWNEGNESLLSEAYRTIEEAVRVATPGGAVIILRTVDPPFAEAMDRALEQAVIAAVESGTLAPDMKGSLPDKGIVVLRRAR